MRMMLARLSFMIDDNSHSLTQLFASVIMQIYPLRDYLSSSSSPSPSSKAGHLELTAELLQRLHFLPHTHSTITCCWLYYLEYVFFYSVFYIDYIYSFAVDFFFTLSLYMLL